MLNGAPNNNDVKHIAIVVFNEAPNSNDATCIANNVCLTTIGAQQFSMATIQSSCRKVDLPEMTENDTMTRRVPVDGNKVCPGKE